MSGYQSGHDQPVHQFGRGQYDFQPVRYQPVHQPGRGPKGKTRRLVTSWVDPPSGLLGGPPRDRPFAGRVDKDGV